VSNSFQNFQLKQNICNSFPDNVSHNCKGPEILVSGFDRLMVTEFSIFFGLGPARSTFFIFFFKIGQSDGPASVCNREVEGTSCLLCVSWTPFFRNSVGNSGF